MNIRNAVTELYCTILDATAAARQAADISARLHTWREVITHPPALDTPISLTPTGDHQNHILHILTPRQAHAMKFVYAYNRITNSMLLGAFPLNHHETIRLDLKSLVQMNLLERHGENKGTYYTLPTPRT